MKEASMHEGKVRKGKITAEHIRKASEVSYSEDSVEDGDFTD